MKIDSKDIEILKLLQSDARISTSEIAERVNMSQSPCWRRINHFEKCGIIKNKVSLLDREKLGMEMVVFASINLATNSTEALENFEREVAVFSEVVECYTMTGVMDYMLKVITRDIRHYEIFVRRKLTQLPNIREIHSHVSVTKIKDTTELPLDTQM